MKIVQCNLNRSRPALNLLMQYITEEDVAICVIAEPPAIIRPNNQWAFSSDNLACIYYRPEIGGLLAIPGASYDGICEMRIGKHHVVACYLSPNGDRSDTLDYLDHLTDVLDSTEEPVIIAGDINAKSPLWGSPIYNWRGQLFEEWIAEDLCVANRGSIPTCVRPQGTSIVDVTLATSNMIGLISDWMVLEKQESLSDHRLISFNVDAYNVHNCVNIRIDNSRVNNNLVIRGWSWTNVNKDDLSAVLDWHFTDLSDLLDVPDNTVDTILHEINKVLTEAADFAAKRKKKEPPNRSQYWWDERLASLRASTVRSRRQSSRYRGRRDLPTFDEAHLSELESDYKLRKSQLRTAIIDAKSKAWSELLLLIDEDPWGLPFKIVTGKLRKTSPVLTELLSAPEREAVLSRLFPPGPTHDPIALWRDFRWDEPFGITATETDIELRRRPSRGAAPGPDGIPQKVIKGFPDSFIEMMSRFYSKCIHDGKFSTRWKTGRLVLIPKAGGNDASGLPKSRPICVLDELGKALERIIHKRINNWFRENPRHALSPHQYGFVEWHSTVDALRRVTGVIEDAFSCDYVVVAVGIDIENAFNLLPWRTIRAALEHKCVPDYLKRILDSYLYDREIIYPTSDGLESRAMQAGVPQGSVLGPLLWNVGYNSILHKTLERNSQLICYADDTLILTHAADEESVVLEASFQAQRILNEIRE
ncbi:Reverse transcriptase [Camponotus japonicus]